MLQNLAKWLHLDINFGSIEALAACPNCGAKCQEFPQRLDAEGEYRVFRCESCGFSDWLPQH